MSDHGGIAPSIPNRLEVKDGKLMLHGCPVVPKFGRRGVQVGCQFVTYEALDKLYQESQQ